MLQFFSQRDFKHSNPTSFTKGILIFFLLVGTNTNNCESFGHTNYMFSGVRRLLHTNPVYSFSTSRSLRIMISSRPSKTLTMKRRLNMMSSPDKADGEKQKRRNQVKNKHTNKYERPKPLVIIIAGPTAVGKSAVAAKLCNTEWSAQIIQEHALNNHVNGPASASARAKESTMDTNAHANANANENARGHIISADSVQVYNGVQIGANKPTILEREETPHHLIDIVDSKSVCQYNAADWMRDAMQVLDNLKQYEHDSDGGSDAEHDSDSDSDSDNAKLPHDAETLQRKATIENLLSEKREDGVEVLPIIVGGTMMYLQWLVKGRPDAMKPSPEAVEKAANKIKEFQGACSPTSEESEDGWNAAVDNASSLGQQFADRAAKLPGKDWYRLRRILEVAYTVLDDDSYENDDKDEIIKKLYNGQRQGGLDTSPKYDVRCFFLCPDDRMAHTAVVDSRCEDMLIAGLLKETTDLYTSGELPEDGQQGRAIGYRQTIEYLKRDKEPKNVEEFEAYLNGFQAATRRYAKKQMQWFRREANFAFIPVQITETSSVRVDAVVNVIKDMCTKPREEFDMELRSSADIGTDNNGGELPLSARTKAANEKQGKEMKFYQTKRHKLTSESKEYASAMEEVDECTSRMKIYLEANS